MDSPQFSLFGDPPPYQAHSQTSRDAATEILPGLNALQAKVLAYLKKVGRTGATDEQMQRALNMNPSTQRPRRIELVTKGLIVTNRNRKTLSGRWANVWEIAP